MTTVRNLILFALLTMIPAGRGAKVVHTGVQRFAMEPQDQTAIVGSKVTLPCRVESKVGQLQWTKDDFGLGWHRNLSGFDRYSMIGSDEEGDYSLEIYPVMLDDEARYQCQVSPGKDGTPGIRSRFASITILVPPEPPKIIQGDFLVTTEDREIELECVSVGGKPAAEITWIDGLGNVMTKGIEYVKEPLTDTGRYTAKSILKLTPKKEHHNTSFTCQAQNTADRTYRSVKLKLEVKYAPKVSVSVIGGALAGGRIPEGAEVRLSCHADSNPNDVSYKWYINDELVVGDYTTEMIIHNVSKKFHDAVVKCEVHNAVGKSEESEILDISYGPTFRSRPKSVEADQDRPVTLSCDVDGNPQPEVIWIHEESNRVVSTTANITIVASRETAGNYFCKASVMGFPEIETVASVYLKGPPQIRSQRAQYGAVNDNSQIQCEAISVPKAKQIIWTYNGLEITNENDYTILENHQPEGVRSTLIINNSQKQHFGVYNCTVINEYGMDSIEIDFKVSKDTILLPVIIFGSIGGFILVIIMIIIAMCFCVKKSKKKLPPADVIPEQHYITEKACKESDRSSNVSDLKIDRDHEYSETCSGTDSIATRLAMNILGSSSGGSNNSGGNNGSGGGGGVPLAGPVRIPSDYRYSGDFTDGLGTLQSKIGQSNGGYVPYVDYAHDYNMPLHVNTNSQSHHQMPNGNLSLTRNRLELRQDNGLPSIGNGMGSLSNSLMNTSLMTAPSIDPRYSATYGNPYLRSSTAQLPPLPPPSTANPAVTPAPPPYSAGRGQQNSLLSMGVNLGVGNGPLLNNGGSIVGITSGLTSPESIRSSSTAAANSSMDQTSQQSSQPTPTLPTQSGASPGPGQFILPANGDLRKGALATHV
ncbi:irregular chiasm C-roughest protein [Culex quinquefasciatus]|uniref:irregular chiasm C-roughest protein n=1 Tax=Culex quinquefasciatus TaxID=7176 RepID=UPI0018E320C4|nr:irregular chiasm C-roughest protein [Culex quinquefasciatus]